MATKDWKKIRKFEWINKKEDVSSVSIFLQGYKDWGVKIIDEDKNYIMSFNTKPKAISYARKYMRTH